MTVPFRAAPAPRHQRSPAQLLSGLSSIRAPCSVWPNSTVSFRKNFGLSSGTRPYFRAVSIKSFTPLSRSSRHDDLIVIVAPNNPRYCVAALDCLSRARYQRNWGLSESVPLIERKQNPRRLFLSGLLEGGRLFGGHVMKHARENRNISLVLDQRTEMIGVK
jgi:hypothetical protein